jgi:hypothetical protein
MKRSGGLSAAIPWYIKWYNWIKHLWDWRETGYQTLLWFGGLLFFSAAGRWL